MHKIIDSLIESEADLQNYLDELRLRAVTVVALDMEGDQGLLRYNYSISIFQCFDGLKRVIIDVLKIGNKPVLHQFLNSPDIVKVMFSCANDIFMTQNVLGCSISPIRDIAIGQKILGLPINLSDYLKIDKAKKDSFQRANWLRRPIRPDLLEYAINDVLELLNIENNLIAQLKSADLFQLYIQESGLLSKRNFMINQLRQYKVKFPGYKRLRPDKKRLAANVWIFRELLGKHFDCPVGFLLSKPAMVKIISFPDNLLFEIEAELNRNRREKKVAMELIEKLYQKAVALNSK